MDENSSNPFKNDEIENENIDINETIESDDSTQDDSQETQNNDEWKSKYDILNHILHYPFSMNSNPSSSRHVFPFLSIFLQHHFHCN